MHLVGRSISISFKKQELHKQHMHTPSMRRKLNVRMRICEWKPSGGISCWGGWDHDCRQISLLIPSEQLAVDRITYASRYTPSGGPVPRSINEVSHRTIYSRAPTGGRSCRGRSLIHHRCRHRIERERIESRSQWPEGIDPRYDVGGECRIGRPHINSR